MRAQVRTIVSARAAVSVYASARACPQVSNVAQLPPRCPLFARSHGIAVIGHPAPSHKGSRDAWQGLAMDFLSFSEMVLGLQLGNRCDYSVPIFPEAFFGGQC